MTSLLDQLSAGPGDPRFESAVQILRDSKFPDRPADRAAARKLIAERDWYLSILVDYPDVHFDDTLEAIFRHAVIPDLGRPDVTEELSHWAAAPLPVIKALSGAARSRPSASEQMKQVLEPLLGRRWLTEHGIYTGSSGYAASARRGQGAHAASGPRSQWTDLLDGVLHGDPVSLLGVFCVVLIVLLVLSLNH